MAWLLFMDESGHSHKELPYEVRGGFALADTHLGPFVQDTLRLEISCFGARLAEYKSEIKGMKLLSKDRFAHAEQQLEIELADKYDRTDAAGNREAVWRAHPKIKLEGRRL